MGGEVTAPVGSTAVRDAIERHQPLAQPARPHPRVRRHGAASAGPWPINAGIRVRRGRAARGAGHRRRRQGRALPGDHGLTDGRGEDVPDDGRSRRRGGGSRRPGVRYVFGAYTDLHGVPKSKCVPLAHFEDMAAGLRAVHRRGAGGHGQARPQRGRVRRHPRPGRAHRAALGPALRPGAGRPRSSTASPYTPRLPPACCRRQVAAAAALGYACNVGVEPEVYVLRQRRRRAGVPFVAEDLDNQPTRGLRPRGDDARRRRSWSRWSTTWTTLGWDVYSFDHEGGDGQYEFDFGYTDALAMADRMVLFRLMAKHVARTLGCIATFMPKPFVGGVRLGRPLQHEPRRPDQRGQPVRGRGGERARRRAADRGYSELAYQFTAGVLAPRATRSPPWSARRSTPTSACCPAG